MVESGPVPRGLGLPGRRVLASRASVQSPFFMLLLTRQPTIRRGETSTTKATRASACHVDTYVKLKPIADWTVSMELALTCAKRTDRLCHQAQWLRTTGRRAEHPANPKWPSSRATVHGGQRAPCHALKLLPDLSRRAVSTAMLSSHNTLMSSQQQLILLGAKCFAVSGCRARAVCRLT